MAKFHVVYFGSNEVPVHLIKPILAEIDADMTIRRPTSDADVVEMAKDADGIIMHGSVPLSRVLAILALLVFGALFALGNYNAFVRERAPEVADTLLTFLPRTHMLDLWRPAFVDRLPSVAVLIALGVVYFAVGYAYRARRDT